MSESLQRGLLRGSSGDTSRPRRKPGVLDEAKKKNFANEAEEAAWWESQEDSLADEFEKASAEGRVGVGTVAKRAGFPTTTIRLDPDDIAKAREQAAARGLRYQTYLKMIIHEALHKAKSARKTATR
jgi:predicted DNA binding CopG/RHH family protein